MFSWISRRKPSKATTEDKGRCSSSSSNESDGKLNMIDHHSFHNGEEVVASQRRDIVKIFVNYEEYGLLAIGTLGYDPSGDVEPEFELFEIRPGALEEVRQQQQERNKNTSRSQRPVDNDQTDDKSKELVLASRLAAKKKVFPLEGLTHIPHISAGFLKSFKLVDRLLHPLNYLGSRSRSRRGSGSLVPWENEANLDNKASLFKELVTKGLRIKSESEDRRYATSSAVKLQIRNDVDELGAACSKMPASLSSQMTKLKKKEGEDWKPKKPMMTTMRRMIRFPCASAADVDEDDEDEDDKKDKDDEDDPRDGGGGVKLSKQCCQVGLEQSWTEDEKEYKIRTESEYVVLEL